MASGWIVKIISLLISATVATCETPTALLPQGIVSGSQDKHNNSVFLGIPFAQTTGGENRWLPPQQLSSSPAQIFNATSYGPTCPQAVTDSHYTHQDEDCLNLNIWVPSNGTKLPVFVYMYGGAMVTGSSSNPQMQGTNFARNGVVYVNFNTRESIWASPNTAELSLNETQNFSILDVEAALDWIHTNIASFGGDPDHIVFGGHSSGSVQVDHYLWNHPDSFLKGAVEMSANVMSGPAYAPMNYAFDTVSTLVNCPTSDTNFTAQLSCMRNTSLSAIETTSFNSTTNTWFAPSIDNITRHRDYPARFEAGLFPTHIPLLTGNNAHEGRVFILVYGSENSNFTSWINTFDADSAHIPSSTLLSAYPHNDFNDSLISGTQYGDARFFCPVDYLLDLRSSQQKTWQYRFYGDAYSNVLGVGDIGSSHGTEVPFFHGGNECFDSLANVTSAQQDLADSIFGWFLRFIKDPQEGPGWNELGLIGVSGREQEVVEAKREEFNIVCQEVYKPYFHEYPVVLEPSL